MDNEVILNECEDLLRPHGLWELIYDPQTNRLKPFDSFKRTNIYKYHISGGQKVLVRLCYDRWNGSGQVVMGDFFCLDETSKRAAAEFYLRSVFAR